MIHPEVRQGIEAYVENQISYWLSDKGKNSQERRALDDGRVTENDLRLYHTVSMAKLQSTEDLIQPGQEGALKREALMALADLTDQTEYGEDRAYEIAAEILRTTVEKLKEDEKRITAAIIKK